MCFSRFLKMAKDSAAQIEFRQVTLPDGVS